MSADVFSPYGSGPEPIGLRAPYPLLTPRVVSTVLWISPKAAERFADLARERGPEGQCMSPSET